MDFKEKYAYKEAQNVLAKIHILENKADHKNNHLIHIINQHLSDMSYSRNDELFGRGHLYGGLFGQGSDYVGAERWYEAKLFNST